MISQETIQEATQRLVRAYNPLTIYLFGKYGWGTPDDDDNLDILVIIESSNEEAYACTHPVNCPGTARNDWLSCRLGRSTETKSSASCFRSAARHGNAEDKRGTFSLHPLPQRIVC